MIVRCGKCQSQLEVAGPGEFMCPACGTRNVVRGGPAQDPLGVPDLGGLAGVPRGPAPPSIDPPGVSWVVCPVCSWRFAVGEVAEVDCPTCDSSLVIEDGRARPAS